MNLMRNWIITILLLGGVVIFTVGCGSRNDTTETTNEDSTVAVQRGNLTIDITAVGNLLFSDKEDLSFALSGTVDQVFISEGDTVAQGQILAEIDTEQWQDSLAELEKDVSARERDLLQKEINLINAELASKNAGEPYSIEELNIAQKELDLAKLSRDQAVYRYNAAYSAGNVDQTWTYSLDIEKKELSLIDAEDKLAELLAGPDPDETRLKELQIDIAQAHLDNARAELEDARNALAEALASGPAILAPFDGLITQVSIDSGDEVVKDMTVIQLTDPTEFEVDIMVNEMDIQQVKQETTAFVQVDSLGGVTLPAEVTSVSPTATIQSGVVSYRVKVKIQSQPAVGQEWPEARRGEMPDISSGELPDRIKQAIEQGVITQEQVDAMMEQFQQGGGGMTRGGQGQTPPFAAGSFQLREGLTVTVSIIISERNDVLLVPNSAITYQGLRSYVEIVTNGTTEEREITIGISDWQYTEVIAGLKEGERVVVPQGTDTSSAATQQNRGGGMRIPGMGGFGR